LCEAPEGPFRQKVPVFPAGDERLRHNLVVLAESGNSARPVLPGIAKLTAQVSDWRAANVAYEQAGANGSRNAGEPAAIVEKLLAHGL
jgi:hypothetical protein